MDTENEQAPVVEEQEEPTQEEVAEESFEQEEETVTIPKQKFVKMQRKAQAYDATKDKPQKTITSNSDAKWRERLELKVDGYNDQETDFILKNGGKKALENPFIVKAIEGIREQQKAEKATVEEGSKSDIEKRFSPQNFAKLKAAEQEKILSEL